jgi:YidC/Oxa1 family membrane protein insertase
MNKRLVKRLGLASTGIAMLLLMSGCVTKELHSAPTGHSLSDIWANIVWFFGWVIKSFSINQRVGIGIILFTILIRVLLFPLMHFQTKSMRKTQELQPEIKKLQEKYPGKDMDSRRMLQEETQRLYAENKVNPYIGCLPLLVQMPVLAALYQAIYWIPELKQGHFLWLNLGNSDPYYILPILAAVFTFFSSWLSMKAAPEQNSMTKSMTYFMPIMIFFMAFKISSGVSLYWAVSNAFQVVQTLLINNPFKIQKEREEKIQAERDLEKRKKKAMKKAMKKVHK